jgi:hypothetical protein
MTVDFSTPQQRLQRKLIRCACEVSGITITRRGQCYVLSGAGVDIMTVDLALVRPHELRTHGVAVRRTVDVERVKGPS